MSEVEPWASLGLAATSDVHAIRSAYAGKLKQIDVDSDPDSFRTLREQHDWAVHLAHSMAAEQSPGEIPATRQEKFVSRAEAGRHPDDVALAASQGGPVAGDPFEAMEQHRARIWQLLTEEKQSPWHSGQIADETRALLHLPIMENIDVTAETEHWLAAAIAQTIPRSDPMVAMVVDQFGWERLHGKVGGFYGLHHALQRRRDIDCSVRLRQPDHRWHQAFLYLQQPPQPEVTPDQKRKIGNHINQLLESIRFHNPTVEAELNADHVAQWDGFIDEAVREKGVVEPIRTSFWSNIFGTIPVWGWILIFYLLALLLGS